MIIKMNESNNGVLSTSEFTSWYDNADNYHAFPKVFEKIEDILGCESNPDSDVSVDYEKLSTDDKKRITNLIKSKSESKSTVTESANPENAELNMKIAKTLGTKLAKEPKYRADLEAAGFEVIDDGWSAYKNWAVKGPNGNSVVLSKDYDGKARIYNGANNLATKQSIDAFDFVNYLTGNFDNRKDYRAHRGIGKTNGTAIRYNRDGSAVDADFSPETKTQQYHGFKKKINDASWDVNYHSDYVTKIESQIAQLKKDIEYHLDKKSGAQDKLNALFDGIDVLLKSAGVRKESITVKESMHKRETKLILNTCERVCEIVASYQYGRAYAKELEDYGFYQGEVVFDGDYGLKVSKEPKDVTLVVFKSSAEYLNKMGYVDSNGEPDFDNFEYVVIPKSALNESAKIFKEADSVDSPEYRIERYEMDLPDLMNTIHDAYMFGKVSAYQYAEALKTAYDALDNVEISKD